MTRPLTPASPSSAPRGFRSPLAAAGGTAQELRCQHGKVLLRPSCPRHCQHMPYLCRTYRTRRQLGPSHPRRSCSRGFPEPHFRCSWAPGKGTKEPFSSPASPGVEREGERKDQCLQNTTIGWKFSSGFSRLGFFSSLFLFLKRGDTSSGQFKNSQALASHICHVQPFLS